MPEALARIHIDQLLQVAGWQVHDLKQANIHTTTGVAIREFPINAGHCVGLGASEFDVLCLSNGAISWLTCCSPG